jgi:hypothetical protein
LSERVSCFDAGKRVAIPAAKANNEQQIRDQWRLSASQQ